MPIPYITKVNQRPVGFEAAIVNEVHVVGTTGLNTSMPDQIRLIEVPLKELPSTVIIPGYVETTSAPGPTEFLVDYTNGRITFNASENGNTVFVTYKGRGSIVDAEDVNELQQVFTHDGPAWTPGDIQNGIANLDGTLSDGIVRPNNISTVATDDFLFPNSVTITGDLTVNGTATYVNTQDLNVEDTIITLNYNYTGVPFQDSGIEIERGTSPNVRVLWNETLDAWEFRDTSDAAILRAYDAGNVLISGDMESASVTTSQVKTNTSQLFDIDYDNTSISETFTWRTNGAATLMTLDEAGNLSVSGYIAGSSLLSNTSLVFGIDEDNNSSSETVTFRSNGSTSIMTLDESGNWFIRGTANIQNGNFLIYNDSFSYRMDLSNGANFRFLTSGGPVGWHLTDTSASTRLFVGNTGNIGVNTTTTLGTGLTVEGGIFQPTNSVSSINGDITLSDPGTGSGATLLLTSTGSNNGGSIVLTAADSINGGNLTLTGIGATRGNISANHYTGAGDITASSGTITGNIITALTRVNTDLVLSRTGQLRLKPLSDSSEAIKLETAGFSFAAAWLDTSSPGFPVWNAYRLRSSDTTFSGGNITTLGSLLLPADGSISIYGSGSISGDVTGGSITVSTSGSNPTGNITGGGLTITTGQAFGGYTQGGSILLTSGQASTTNDGGNITLTSFTPSRGGNITLTGSVSGHGNIVMGGGVIKPSVDSTSAVKIATAGETPVVIVDTSNNRVGINATPVATLHNDGSTLFGLATATDPGSILATTVDTKSGVRISTTSPIVLTLPSPTSSTLGRFFTVLHDDSSTGSLSINLINIGIGKGATFMWDGTAWIPIGATGGFQVVSVDPGSPQTGDVWFNTTDFQFKGYNGTSVVVLG